MYFISKPFIIRGNGRDSSFFYCNLRFHIYVRFGFSSFRFDVIVNIVDNRQSEVGYLLICAIGIPDIRLL